MRCDLEKTHFSTRYRRQPLRSRNDCPPDTLASSHPSFGTIESQAVDDSASYELTEGQYLQDITRISSVVTLVIHAKECLRAVTAKHSTGVHRRSSTEHKSAAYVETMILHACIYIHVQFSSPVGTSIAHNLIRGPRSYERTMCHPDTSI